MGSDVIKVILVFIVLGVILVLYHLDSDFE